MLMATEYLRSVGAGVTRPRLIRADDGRVYVVKLRENKLGHKVLANEYLAAKLGERVGLCLPPSDIISFDEAFVNKVRVKKHHYLHCGRHFASRYLTDTSYAAPYHMARLVNRHEFAGVILFDNLLQNDDRTNNPRNLLVREENDGLHLWAIDHSHIFGSGRWTRERLVQEAPLISINRRRAYGALLRRYLRPEDFEKWQERLSGIGSDERTVIVDMIPEEWLPDSADRQALKDYLAVRFNLLPEITKQLISFIPNQHRSANLNK